MQNPNAHLNCQVKICNRKSICVVCYTLVPWHMHAIIEKQNPENHILLPSDLRFMMQSPPVRVVICTAKFGQMYTSSYKE